MAESITMARPYAQAVFELAKTKKQYQQWSQTLADLVQLSQQVTIAALIANVKVSKVKLALTLRDICGAQVNEQGKNLLSLLIENGRLALLTEIAAVYELLRADAERTIEADVTTAFALSDAQKSQIAQALKKRLGREVTIHAHLDKTILGGAIIRAGDLVIDGSAAGRLAKLAACLT